MLSFFLKARAGIMFKASERDIAQSMLRLWGPDAAQLASEYAASHRQMRNHLEAAKWQSVQGLIVQLRAVRLAAAGQS